MPIVPYPEDLDLTRQAVVSISDAARLLEFLLIRDCVVKRRSNREPPRLDNPVSHAKRARERFHAD